MQVHGTQKIYGRITLNYLSNQRFLYVENALRIVFPFVFQELEKKIWQQIYLNKNLCQKY